MVETAAVGKIDQVNQAAEVYFRLSVYATDLQMQINYRRMNDVQHTYQNFRRCMIELYYIVRYNKDFNKDGELIKLLNKWISDDSGQCRQIITVNYCKNSLLLYNRFTKRLAQIGFVER